jgi:hypothetical protein
MNWRTGAVVALVSGTVTLSQSTLGQSQPNDEIDWPGPVAKIQVWQARPVLPEGWQEIDRKKAPISNKSRPDIFVLITDGKNDQIVWFESVGRYWKMSVIESWPSDKHKTYYGVPITKVRLFIDGKRLLYGLPESDAFSYYDWEPKERLFIRHLPRSDVPPF